VIPTAKRTKVFAQIVPAALKLPSFDKSISQARAEAGFPFAHAPDFRFAEMGPAGCHSSLAPE
jgi:hypothetical protein